MSQENSIAEMGSYNAKSEAGYSMAQMGGMKGAKFFVHQHFYLQAVIIIKICNF